MSTRRSSLKREIEFSNAPRLTGARLGQPRLSRRRCQAACVSRMIVVRRLGMFENGVDLHHGHGGGEFAQRF